jgi:seryl-tRNA synthetase
MVTVDISQLSAECNAWREALRSGKEVLNGDKTNLQTAASKNLSKDQLEQVEHLHNQFHIQLINIHDLKQSIKTHDRKVQFEASANGGQVYEETLEEHENLNDEFQNLQQTLEELQNEFNEFLKQSGQ